MHNQTAIAIANDPRRRAALRAGVQLLTHVLESGFPLPPHVRHTYSPKPDEAPLSLEQLDELAEVLR